MFLNIIVNAINKGSIKTHLEKDQYWSLSGSLYYIFLSSMLSDQERDIILYIAKKDVTNRNKELWQLDYNKNQNKMKFYIDDYEKLDVNFSAIFDNDTHVSEKSLAGYMFAYINDASVSDQASKEMLLELSELISNVNEPWMEGVTTTMVLFDASDAFPTLLQGDMSNTELLFKNYRIYFKGLSEVSRAKLITYLQEAELDYYGISINIQSESDSYR